MSRGRFRLLYYAFLPAIFLAVVVLAYSTWQTASRYSALGEQTIAESILLLVREKVEEVEEYIIQQDNTAFGLVELDAPDTLDNKWRPIAAERTPSIRALVVLDDDLEIVGLGVRDDSAGRQQFSELFERQILPALELDALDPGRLRHLHATFDEQNYLLSFKVYLHQGRRMAIVAHHDTGYLVREEFPRLFATEEGKRQYNVVNAENRRVFGASLANAGDYLVGHRFPTTLYNWRLQVAPKQASLLESSGRTRRLTELGLLLVALFVILLGVAFVLYAAYKERRLNELKGEFIANVSHELKTPLSVVRMFGELLLTKRVRNEEKQQQYLEIICRESERLTTLIENVLDFSALERGRQKYRLEEGDLQDVVANAIDAFRYRMEGAAVELELKGDLPPLLLDRQAVVLALVNLLDNAVKYGEKSPITVTLEQVRDFVQVRVRDRGPGIAPDQEKRIFERFYRSRRNANVRGSGIGLALVRHIAQAHGGRAWATNAEGGGAIVAFALPTQAPPQRLGRLRRNTGGESIAPPA